MSKRGHIWKIVMSHQSCQTIWRKIIGGFLKCGYPLIIHFNGICHHKASILMVCSIINCSHFGALPFGQVKIPGSPHFSARCGSVVSYGDLVISIGGFVGIRRVLWWFIGIFTIEHGDFNGMVYHHRPNSPTFGYHTINMICPYSI